MANESLQKAFSRQSSAWLKSSKRRDLRLIISRPESSVPASPPTGQLSAVSTESVETSASQAPPTEARDSVGSSVLSILQTLREQRLRFEQLVGGTRYREVEHIVSHAGSKTQGAILDTYAG